MKNAFVSIFLTLLLTLTPYLPNAFSQDSPQWHLPEGAKARLGKGTINEIAYSPDGRRLAVASGIGTWIYDARTGKELDLLTGHTHPVNSVAFSPNGRTLASGAGGYAATVRLWDANTGRHLHTLPGQTWGVQSIAFSPDGNTLVMGGGFGGEIDLWNVATGKHLRTLEGHTNSVHSVSFSPDGQTLASVWNTTVSFFDVNTGKHLRTLEGHTNSVFSVSFSPDGQTLASGSLDDTIRLWDVATGRRLRTLEGHTNSVFSVSFSPDGQTLASGSLDDTIRLWDVATGRRLRTLEGHTDNVWSVLFSPDGQTLASGGSYTIRFWDVATGRHLRTLEGHADFVNSIAFSPDGSTLVSGVRDRTVRFWDVATRKHLRTLEGHTNSVFSVSFSPDGQTLASGGSYTIRLWDANTGSHLRTTRTPERGNSTTMDFSPVGNIFAIGSASGTVYLLNVHTGLLRHTLTGHTRWVYSVSFSPDGQTLASGSNDDTIRLWDVATGRHLHTLEGLTDNVWSLSFSPDGQTLASGSNDPPHLWDVATGRLLRTFEEQTGSCLSVVFSPDGSTLASGNRSIHFWDISTGQHLYTLTGHTDGVYSVAFSPDGNTLASGSRDGTVLLWELAPEPTSNATVSLSPATVASPNIGEQITFSLNISEGANVSGYQATLRFDTTALKYIESSNSDYLPTGAFAIPTTIDGNSVTLAATSLAGESSGDGTLATVTFEVVATKVSTVRLSDVLLTNNAGVTSTPQTENAEITKPTHLPEDVNQDGVVNIIDLTLIASNFGETGANAADVNGDGVVNIVDLTLVAAAFGNTAAAPIVLGRASESAPARADVEAWLREARKMNLTDPAFQRGLLMLEQLLAILIPRETILLPNYPNPFNPETWLPYQLAAPADVSIAIYATDGRLVRRFELGPQPVGIYESRSRAAYWNGRNALGEPVASGVYFYTLTAGGFTATRKMLIRK